MEVCAHVQVQKLPKNALSLWRVRYYSVDSRKHYDNHRSKCLLDRQRSRRNCKCAVHFEELFYEILLEVMRCSLATVASGSYQAHILGENLLVIVTTITIYIIAIVKARHSGKQ